MNIPPKPGFMNGSYTPTFKRLDESLICVDVRIHERDATTRATATQRRAYVNYLHWYYGELSRLGSIATMKATHPSIFPQITVRTKKED